MGKLSINDKLLDGLTEYKKRNISLIAQVEDQQNTIDRQSELITDSTRVMKDVEIYSMPDSDLRFSKEYDWKEEKRFFKTIALFDKLWHYDDKHSDGCGKCERYQKILFNAFNTIESISGRTLDEFSSFVRDDIASHKEVEAAEKECDEVYLRLNQCEDQSMYKFIKTRLKQRFSKLFRYRLKLVQK